MKKKVDTKVIGRKKGQKKQSANFRFIEQDRQTVALIHKGVEELKQSHSKDEQIKQLQKRVDLLTAENDGLRQLLITQNDTRRRK